MKRKKKASNTGESSRPDIPRKAVMSHSSGSASRTRDLPCAGVMVVPGFLGATYCPRYCPRQQEHTQDNWNLLRQNFYCLLIRREDPNWENGAAYIARSMTFQHLMWRDVSAPDVV